MVDSLFSLMVHHDEVYNLLQARARGDFAAERAAEARLREAGGEMLPGLIALLERADLPSLQTQWEAVIPLTTIGEAALPELFRVLREGEPGPRWAAGEAITYIGAPSLPGLVEALRHPNPEVRHVAAYGLIYCGDARAAPALLEAMRDGDALVRLGALKALRHIADPDSELPLRAALAAGVTPRTAVAWALKGVQAQAVLRLLDDLHQQTEAGEAARIGIRRIWESEPRRLLSVLHGGRYVMRARAADALALLGDPAAVPDLLRALDDEVDVVRGHAANALGQIKDRRALPPLLSLLGEDDMLLRWTAAEALGRLGDPAAVLPLLLAWIDADHEMILEVTGEALSRIGEAAHGPLREALNDPREEVQRAARYILGQLGAPQ